MNIIGTPFSQIEKQTHCKHPGMLLHSPSESGGNPFGRPFRRYLWDVPKGFSELRRGCEKFDHPFRRYLWDVPKGFLELRRGRDHCRLPLINLTRRRYSGDYIPNIQLITATAFRKTKERRLCKPLRISDKASKLKTALQILLSEHRSL